MTGVHQVVLPRRKRIPPAPSSQPLDLLGCLSCFRLFIPTGGSFNLFRIFRKDNGISINPQKVHDTGAYISSSGTTDGKGNSEGCFGLFKSRRKNTRAENPQQNTSKEEKGKAVVDEEFGHNQHVKENDDTRDISFPSIEEQFDHTVHIESKERLSHGKIIEDKGHVNGTAGKFQNAKTYPTTQVPGCVPPTKVKIGIEQPGDSAIIDVNEGLPESVAPHVTCVIPDATSSKPIEILKSIVYGGLTELITSLSVVSSAAASDVSTLNILALALANLIGGLPIFGHNLIEMKDARSRDTSDRVDRYPELLGRRENFLLHATLAVLSYILFGLIPPATYAFSFYESDNKDFRLLAVAATSLLCVLLLAFAKAYIQRAPKFYMYLKTISYHVIAAFMASGASYAAGSQIKKLMENLGLFDKSAEVAFSLSEMKAVNPSWASF